MLFSRTTFQVADFDHSISNSLFLPVLFKLKMSTCTKFPRLATLPKYLVSSDRRQDMSRDWRCQMKTGKKRVDWAEVLFVSSPSAMTRMLIVLRRRHYLLAWDIRCIFQNNSSHWKV